MKVSLDDMMVFRLVVEQGSFTKAALAMGLPKSNISRKISRLENLLEARLLERSTRSLHLTQLGQVYYQHCIRIHEEAERANECVEVLSSSPKGRLRVCASVSIGQNLMVKKLASFYQQYPEIELDLQLLNRRIDLVEEGFDLAIRVGELEDSSLISKPLFELKLHLYASPDYLAGTQQGITALADLTSHHCLYMNASNDKARWFLQSQDEKRELDFQPIISCNDFSSLFQLTCDGLGVALLPDYLCTEALQQGRLIKVLPQWQGKSVAVNAIYPSRKSMTPKLRAMLDFLSQ